MCKDESPSPSLQRVRVTISGRVQGVAYRWSTRDKATELGLAGWVRNLPTRGVEAVFEGDARAVSDMVAWCWKGPALAHVTGVEVVDQPTMPGGPLSGFEIRG